MERLKRGRRKRGDSEGEKKRVIERKNLAEIKTGV